MGGEEKKRGKERGGWGGETGQFIEMEKVRDKNENLSHSTVVWAFEGLHTTSAVCPVSPAVGPDCRKTVNHYGTIHHNNTAEEHKLQEVHENLTAHVCKKELTKRATLLTYKVNTYSVHVHAHTNITDDHYHKNHTHINKSATAGLTYTQRAATVTHMVEVHIHVHVLSQVHV